MGLATNLWPEDIAKSALRAPVSILREQAAFLAKQTNGLLTAEVRTAPGQKPGEIGHRFVLVAPALGGYEYDLFRISHKMVLYPLEAVDYSGSTTSTSVVRVIRDESQFLEWLKLVLGGDRTKHVIHSLLAQVTDAAPAE